MKPTQELFKLTPEHKKTLASIGALCGVKQDTIMLVLEYVLYTNVIQALDSNDDGKISVSIPLLGDVEYNDESGESTIQLTQNFQKILRDAASGNVEGIKKYFEDKWLTGLVEEIENT